MEDFAKKLAINHHVENYSNLKTFPLSALREDYQKIVKAYDILNESISKDVSIPPSGEWLLDNFYVIEEQYHTVMNELPKRVYRKLPSVCGMARILVIAREYVTFTDGNVSEETIEKFILSYQTKRSLSLDEITLFPLMLQIALLHHIRIVADRIVVEQLEKFKVESLMERIVSQKKISEQQFQKYRKVNLNGEIMTYIEYLVYSLKKLGREELIDILEAEIIKKGTSSAEIVKTLHFDMAVRRISISNSILSIKNMTRYNWTMLFEKINPLEMILKQDEIYEKMNYQTKQMYLEEIRKIAQKTHLSEVYVGNVLIKLHQKAKKHIGFFLFREERKLLAKEIESPKIYHKKTNRTIILSILIICIYFPSFAFSYYMFQNYFWLGIIPLTEIFFTLFSFFVRKMKKPKLLPQMEEVSELVETMVIIPTLLNSKERVLKAMSNMEVYYLANRETNLRFCLLGDPTECDTETISQDEEIKVTGINEAKRLNQKYQKNLFFFAYRKRIFNSSQESWLGYERKRGMIEEFNHFLRTGEKGTFCINTIEDIPQIKYIITLDADTNLILGSAKKLIGIMEHPLNEPVIKKGRVVSGYGLIQPKINVSITECHRTLFSKLFAGNGGLDMYSGAEFNLYQDLFEEAIFTGKGIFRVELYEKFLYHKIPENKILSHDLLEGSFLRTGLACDVTLMDGFPSSVNAYFFRLKRWTRGDIQTLSYLFHPRLKVITKYQIWDNLRRSLIPIFTFLLFCKGYFLEALTVVFFPFLWELLSTKRKFFLWKKKNCAFHLQGLMASLYRCIATLFFLPYHAMLMLEAISVSLYRMAISKKHLLEWTTAEDSEKMIGKDLKSYVKNMMIAIAPIFLFCATRYHFVEKEWLIDFFLLIIWLNAPLVAYDFSKELQRPQLRLKQTEKKEVMELASRTWNFFEKNLTKDNHYLIPDNYQEERKRQTTTNTSSTNIGLSMLAIISAFDLKLISKKEMITYLKNILTSIFELEKWKGHLYNWYDITTLRPLEPRFISTVDSGNFVAYLYVVKTILDENHEETFAQKVSRLIIETDFGALYDNDKNLFSIGFDERERKLVNSYYDLLASEARTASYIAICKHDIPYKHWFYLGRSMTQMNGNQGLLSWAGTMFEYFMPRVIMHPHSNTLLSEANRFCITSQQKYAAKFNIPWGISEAAFYLQDFHYHYQYKAFGIPWLGLKRGLKDELVVSPYSSVLAISEVPKEVLKNLRRLKKMGAYNQYGFYESIDFTPSRVKDKFEIVKTYMAHHQALILLSINNYLKDDVLVKRFMSHPEIKSSEILLEERIPEQLVFTKEKKEKTKPLKYQDYEEYVEMVIHKERKNVNILSGEGITMLMNDLGEGYVKTDGIFLYPYGENHKISSTFFVKDITNHAYWTNTIKPGEKNPEESFACFSPAFCEFSRRDNQIQTTTKYILSSEEKVILKKLELYSHRKEEAIIEMISIEELALCSKESFVAHPAYQGLSLCAQPFHHEALLEKRFHQRASLYYMNFVTDEQGAEGCFDIELDPLKVIGRGRNLEKPIIVEQDKMLSNQIVSWASPVVALKKRIVLPPEEKITFYFYSAVANSIEEMDSLYEKYHKFGAPKRLEELAIGKAKIENRFLGFKGKEIMKFHEILAEILNGSESLKKYQERREKNRMTQKDLWRFGISGDIPIILFRTSKLEDAFLLEKYIRAVVYFCHKQVHVDLVILNGEKNSYEQFHQEKIYELLSKENANSLIGQKGGIHVLKEVLLSEEEINLLYACSDLIIEK